MHIDRGEVALFAAPGAAVAVVRVADDCVPGAGYGVGALGVDAAVIDGAAVGRSADQLRVDAGVLAGDDSADPVGAAEVVDVLAEDVAVAGGDHELAALVLDGIAGGAVCPTQAV